MQKEEAIYWQQHCNDLNLSKKHSHIKKEVIEHTSFLPMKSPLQQRLYHIIENSYVTVKCSNESCDNQVKWDTSLKQYKKYCCLRCSYTDPVKIQKSQAWKQDPEKFKHANKKGLESRQKTNLERYGHTNFLASEPGQAIGIKSKIERYGEDFREQELKKRTETMLKLYNTHAYPTTSDFWKKRNETMLEKYGVIHSMQNDFLKLKAQLTNIEKYGVDNPSKNKDIRANGKLTCIEKYGVENYSQSSMIDILPLIQNKEWLIDQYINQHKTAVQIAEELHISDGTIGQYLRRHEIGIKQTIWYSARQIQWLNLVAEKEEIYIQHALNEGEYQIPGTRYKADGYCSETNTIYEFHGDYWHGNPEVYAAELINEVSGKSMGELYENTIIKENVIKELGYNLVVMWEGDFV
ncbi:MAG: DUF7487 domain-containing protein [Nitrososphaeraceae archaeon]